MQSIPIFYLFLLLIYGLPAAPADESSQAKPLLSIISAVKGEGAGNGEAADAWRHLAKLGPDVIPEILLAMNETNSYSSNWLRGAVDAIAERAIADRKPLPVKELEAFVLQTKNATTARSWAFACLTRADPSAPQRLLPGMLDDPGAELRREAVAQALAYSEALLKTAPKTTAAAVYKSLLDHARDRDQVDRIIKLLKGLDVNVDVVGHYGFITTWWLAGPFDSSKGIGFQRVYPPEQRVDLSATLEGKKGKKVQWFSHRTTVPSGSIDLNKAVGKNMGAVAYAYTVVTSPAERSVELRAASNDAVKIFLNGQQIYFREEYHHGQEMDQHVGRGTLKAGRNEILVKVCQNEQTDVWAQEWSFMLRLCDDLGAAVPFQVVTDPSSAR